LRPKLSGSVRAALDPEQNLDLRKALGVRAEFRNPLDLAWRLPQPGRAHRPIGAGLAGTHRRREYAPSADLGEDAGIDAKAGQHRAHILYSLFDTFQNRHRWLSRIVNYHFLRAFASLTRRKNGSERLAGRERAAVISGLTFP
jgi:hypothetical protein